MDSDFFNHEHMMMKSLEDNENEECFAEFEEILQEFGYSSAAANSSGFLHNNINSSNNINDNTLSMSMCDSTLVAPAHNQSESNPDSNTNPSATKVTNHSIATLSKTRTYSKSVDHILAERKRRHQMSQLFIELSASIPGLKKIDKVSIIREALTYVKHLENRVKELEEECPREKISFTDKIDCDLCCTNLRTASYKTNYADFHGLPLQLEAKELEKQVFIRIHCQKLKGVLLQVFSHIKSLDLSIISNTVLPFGNSILHVTIFAQMGDNYNLTMKELVKSLRHVLFKSSC